MIPLVDAHNHLQEEVLAPHLPQVLERARAAGVTHQIVNGTHEGDWGEVAALADENPDVLPCYGLHPWFVSERSPQWLERLRERLKDPRACIGEIGLDRWIEPRDEPAQQEVFVAQLRLARELDRPVMVHCLRAWGWLLELLAQETTPPLLIHAYGGAAELIPRLVARGGWLSFGGNVLDERKRRAREALLAAPLDRLLIETDAPALLPPTDDRSQVITGDDGKPYNEPANLPLILEGIAGLRGMAADELREMVWENSRRFLGGRVSAGRGR